MLLAVVEESFEQGDAVDQQQSVCEHSAQRSHLCLEDIAALVQDRDRLAVDVPLNEEFEQLIRHFNKYNQITY